MTLLVADVGGTNTRVALDGGGRPTALRHFDNDDFDSLPDVLRAYRAAQADLKIDACVIAIAGPVEGERGQLTNRNWHVDLDQIKMALGCDSAKLLNDLAALGHALAQLPSDACMPIQTDTSKAHRNGQSLVVGIGTGFNLCPVIALPGHSAQCLAVEAGHTSLPRPVTDHLPFASEFATAEDLFSGRGFARLHALHNPSATLSGRQIVEAHRAGTDPTATSVLTQYVDLLGRFCAELTLQYMPLEGIYFAGSVARGILSADMHAVLRRNHGNGGRLGNLLARIPISLILDDAAALYGCIAAAER